MSWEYGPATLRAMSWTRRRRVPVLVFSELTPVERRRADGAPATRSQAAGAARRRVHRGLVAGGRAARSLGVDPERVEVALQSADLSGVAAPAGARRTGPRGCSPSAGSCPTRTSTG